MKKNVKAKKTSKAMSLEQEVSKTLGSLYEKVKVKVDFHEKKLAHYQALLAKLHSPSADKRIRKITTMSILRDAVADGASYERKELVQMLSDAGYRDTTAQSQVSIAIANEVLKYTFNNRLVAG